MTQMPWDEELWLDNVTNSSFNRTCVAWAEESLSECVQNWWGIAGIFIGYSSIGFWCFAQAPQLYLNFKNKNADSLSLPFLAAWLIGDTTNLLGSVLSRQLATQIYTSIYFFVIDVILFSQWIAYAVVLKRMQRRGSKVQRRSHVTLPVVAGLSAMSGLAMWTFKQDVVAEQGPGRILHAFTNPTGTGTPLDSEVIIRGVDVDPYAGYPFVQGTSHSIGYAIGIVSACFYLVSRVPQIIKNYKRQSTGGLSFIMFLMAIMGNLTYAVSVMTAAFQPNLYDGATPPNRITSRAFIIDKLPWLFGSVGTLMFDFTIFFQFWHYGDEVLSMAEEIGVVGTDTEKRPLLEEGDSDESLEEGNVSFHSSYTTSSPLIFPASKKSTSYQRLDRDDYE